MTRQGRPVGLIIAGVAVLAAGLLLLLIMKSGDDDAAADPQATGGSGGSAAPRARPRPSDGRPNAPQLTSIDRGDRGDRGSAGGDPGYTETVINGVRVRDHRKDRSAPIPITPGRRPPDARKIQSSLTADISNRIVPIVRECGAGVPPEARGEKPRIDGEIGIAIRNKQVVITRAALQLTDVVGASVEPTQQCLQQKVVGLTVPAGDEADLEDYTITVRFGLL